MHKIINDLQIIGESVVEQIKQALPRDKWDLIWNELCLEEIGWVAISTKTNREEDD